MTPLRPLPNRLLVFPHFIIKCVLNHTRLVLSAEDFIVALAPYGVLLEYVKLSLTLVFPYFTRVYCPLYFVIREQLEAYYAASEPASFSGYVSSLCLLFFCITTLNLHIKLKILFDHYCSLCKKLSLSRTGVLHHTFWQYCFLCLFVTKNQWSVYNREFFFPQKCRNTSRSDYSGIRMYYQPVAVTFDWHPIYLTAIANPFTRAIWINMYRYFAAT